ncbi:MAG: glycyl-radical enzyme activating protein [Candidatus Marinimicrobia bacterium]|nr:glycyl-radical enzyme activating protein [Candidatus Neomarinimicrobiota bacterium]
MREGTVFDIKKFATHDGPGIRTTVFLKGCALDCWWCHNPESKNSEIEKNHSGGHLEKSFIGENYSVSRLFNEIIKDEIFFEESRGGVTFSGGEAMLQVDFLQELLKKCKFHGLHTAVDTSGYCPQENFVKILPYTDLFLYDIKIMDPVLHQKYTGKSNELILTNFEYLISRNANIQIRIPLIPRFTDNETNLSAIKTFLKPFRPLIDIELIPYNKLGESKIRRYTDKLENLQTQSKKRLQELRDFFEI